MTVVTQADDAKDDDRQCKRPALHFIGFRGDEYHSARRVFGPPDFIHIGWDHWAAMEVMPDDTAVFARDEWDRRPSEHSYPDLREDEGAA